MFLWDHAKQCIHFGCRSHIFCPATFRQLHIHIFKQQTDNIFKLYTSLAFTCTSALRSGPSGQNLNQPKVWFIFFHHFICTILCLLLKTKNKQIKTHWKCAHSFKVSQLLLTFFLNLWCVLIFFHNTGSSVWLLFSLSLRWNSAQDNWLKCPTCNLPLYFFSKDPFTWERSKFWWSQELWLQSTHRRMRKRHIYLLCDCACLWLPPPGEPHLWSSLFCVGRAQLYSAVLATLQPVKNHMRNKMETWLYYTIHTKSTMNKTNKQSKSHTDRKWKPREIKWKPDHIIQFIPKGLWTKQIINQIHTQI